MKRQRKTKYRVFVDKGTTKEFRNKAGAVRYAAVKAIETDHEVIIHSVTMRTGSYATYYSNGNVVIYVDQYCRAEQFGKLHGRRRGSFSKYIRGYGKLYDGCLNHWKKWKGKK